MTYIYILYYLLAICYQKVQDQDIIHHELIYLFVYI